MKRGKIDADAVTQGLSNMVNIVNEARDQEEEPEREEIRFVAVGLDSREQERNELGEPQPKDQCFACTYAGEREMGAAPYEEVMKFIDQIRKCRTNTKLITLAKDVAEQYEAFRKAVNDTLLTGEKPLPEWRAATILEHIRKHTADAEMMLVNMLDDLSELEAKALHASVERNQFGEERINERQHKCYLDTLKMKLQVYRTDPTKLLFYSGGAAMDMKSASNGGFSTSGKKLFELWHK